MPNHKTDITLADTTPVDMTPTTLLLLSIVVLMHRKVSSPRSLSTCLLVCNGSQINLPMFILFWYRF